MKRKMSVLGSLNNPNATWYPNENQDIERLANYCVYVFVTINYFLTFCTSIM